MADLKALIDWFVNTALQLFNTMKQAGIYFYVWVSVLFVFPWFRRLLRALKGSR